jgi:hypothetical protein
MLFRTGAIAPHAVFTATTEGSSRFAFFEAPTPTADGTPVTIYNNNRLSTNTATPLVFHTPSFNATGTLLYVDLLPAGFGSTAGGASGGGPIREGSEWILKPSTDYLLESINRTGSAIGMALAVSFYEADFPEDFS